MFPNIVQASPVGPAVASDVEGWLRLAGEVEPLFGPMAQVPDFRDALTAAIAQEQAFTSSSPAGFDGRVLGGIVICKATNSIEWLAVSASARGLGIGGRLLQMALDQLNQAQPVSVQTFARSVPEGSAARHLYRKYGFEDHAPMAPNPAGIATVLMIKPPRSRGVGVVR